MKAPTVPTAQRVLNEGCFFPPPLGLQNDTVLPPPHSPISHPTPLPPPGSSHSLVQGAQLRAAFQVLFTTQVLLSPHHHLSGHNSSQQESTCPSSHPQLPGFSFLHLKMLPSKARPYACSHLLLPRLPDLQLSFPS